MKPPLKPMPPVAKAPKKPGAPKPFDKATQMATAEQLRKPRPNPNGDTAA